ncbi:MAG: hypothetical protein IKE69_03100 [Thermoguttaceae bacterium]|nr:hypothetical protein [Thermoguttaceae bacterium]
MKSRRRNGLTLTELLVVGTIILAVTALSIPVVKPMMESQLTKNGANMLATALNRARSRAQVTGRPCGVRFEYWPGTVYTFDEHDGYIVYDDTGMLDHAVQFSYSTPGASLVMRQVEVPPAYTGLLGTETVKYNEGRCVFQNDVYIESELGRSASAKIQIGGDGPFYPFERGSTSLKDSAVYALPPQRDVEYPFKVLLDSRPTMAMPVCMPRGTAVDLQFSGVGDTVFLDTAKTTGDGVFRQATALTIMFAPDGSVESVTGMIDGTIPSEPIHFLVGRWDQIGAVRPDGDEESYPNYADGRNYWVSVFPQTGVVTVNQVNPTADGGYDPSFRPSKYDIDTQVPDVRLPEGVIAVSRELTK